MMRSEGANTAVARIYVEMLAAALALMSSPFDNEVLIAARWPKRCEQAGVGWSDPLLREGPAVPPLRRPPGGQDRATRPMARERLIPPPPRAAA
jgi:hypothetical protein